MTIMEQEIDFQPEGLKLCKDFNMGKITQLAQIVRDKKIKHICMAARGSSDNACNYFKYLCEVYAGIPVSFAAPSVVTLYNGKLDLSDTLVVGVSQSGKAEDVIAILDRAKSCGGVTAAITNNTESPMAKCVDHHIFLNVGEEKSVAATKTFTAQLYALGLLVAAISQSQQLFDDLDKVPTLIKEVIAVKDQINTSSDRYVKAIDAYVLARGINYASAQESALKIQETTYIKARAYAISDFHHGPFAVVDEKTNVLIISPNDKSAADSEEMILKAKATGADMTVFTDSKRIADLADSAVLIPSCPESVTPFIYVTAAQLFSCNLSVKRGLNPDAPRGLKKVTITK